MNTRRGAQLANTNALKHGRFSTRFTNLATATANAQEHEPGPLARQLQLLDAVIEDLANQETPQPALLIHAIRTYAQVAMAKILIEERQSGRGSGVIPAYLRNNPDGHSRCWGCDDLAMNKHLADHEGLCYRCAAQGLRKYQKAVEGTTAAANVDEDIDDPEEDEKDPGDYPIPPGE
jgi:hypothetical protein